MNKTIKDSCATCFGNPNKFQTFEPVGYGQVQIRDNRSDKHRPLESHGIVAVFPVMGGQFATYQSRDEAVKLARKIVRYLNKQP